MSQNEKTSKSVATIASEILSMKKPYIITDELWADILSLAGSALTQAPDKKPNLYLSSILAKKNSSIGLWSKNPLLDAFKKSKENK